MEGICHRRQSPQGAQSMSRFFVSAAVLMFTLVGFDANAGSRTLRVLTYNVKGLPDLITKTDSNRFADIGRILAERRKAGTAPDIVLIQEAFIPRTQELVKESGYPHFAKGPNATDVNEKGKPQKTVYGAGLYVLSEFPILATKKVAYDLNTCAEADCGSNKGAMMVALDVPGLTKPLKVFNTHAQAVRKYDDLRAKQYRIFAKFISDNLDGEPFLIGGDFNSRPADPSFLLWETLTLTTATGGYCVMNTALCQIDPRTEIAKAFSDSVDHIFFSLVPTLSGISTRPLSLMRNFDEPVRGRKLSDHLGYEAEFEVSWLD
jgi:endonuclease/exonuclease/phosphatase family metal-dependent hydrolase